MLISNLKRPSPPCKKGTNKFSCGLLRLCANHEVLLDQVNGSLSLRQCLFEGYCIVLFFKKNMIVICCYRSFFIRMNIKDIQILRYKPYQYKNDKSINILKFNKVVTFHHQNHHLFMVHFVKLDEELCLLQC